MRNLNIVVHNIVDTIPLEEFALAKQLLNCLSPNKAPEVRWELVQEIISKNFSNPTKDWEFKVLSIWTEISIEKIKLFVNSYKK